LACSPRSSRPTLPTNTERAPSRAAAEAWFAPFPPPPRWNVPSRTVSPGPGSRGTRTTRSAFTDPTTTTTGRSPLALASGLGIRRSVRRAFRRRKEGPEDGGFGGGPGPVCAHVDSWQGRSGNTVPPAPLVAGEPGLARPGGIDLRGDRGIRRHRPRVRLGRRDAAHSPASSPLRRLIRRRRTTASPTGIPAPPRRRRGAPPYSARRG